MACEALGFILVICCITFVAWRKAQISPSFFDIAGGSLLEEKDGEDVVRAQCETTCNSSRSSSSNSSSNICGSSTTRVKCRLPIPIPHGVVEGTYSETTCNDRVVFSSQNQLMDTIKGIPQRPN